MAKIPPGRATEQLPGLDLLNRGKVRDTYALPGHPGLLLVVASNRISIFDHVLDAEVPQKGADLTAENVFWRRGIMRDQFPHDLVACGSEIDAYLPASLRNNVRLQGEALVVRRLAMLPVEMVVRGHLTGTGLKAYQNNDGIVCGHQLPAGLSDGDRLEQPIFTPTTKAEIGHDEHITAASVAKKWGKEPEMMALALFSRARDYARSRGIILADTKFEFGLNPENNLLTIGDEVITPDSSRFWDKREWEAAQAKDPRKSPTPFDKQLVRNWGKTLGIDKRDPANGGDVAWVHAQTVPKDILALTTRVYRYIFWRLTGQKLEDFQRTEMGMDVKPPKTRVEVIIGSESDLPQMTVGIDLLRQAAQQDRVDFSFSKERNVLSCHRTPRKLREFLCALPADENVVVIAGAGMAAALPGVAKSLLCEEGKSHIPVIGVGFVGKNEDANLAARLSIEQLPGQPVELRSHNSAYFGPDGFQYACISAIEDEFAPKSFGGKPA